MVVCVYGKHSNTYGLPNLIHEAMLRGSSTWVCVKRGLTGKRTYKMVFRTLSKKSVLSDINL